MTLHDVISGLESPLVYKQNNIYPMIPEFMQNDDFMLLLERYVDTYYGKYDIIKPFADLPLNTQSVPIVLTNVYAANKYMLDTLYATTQLDYNPIENYRMIETENTKNTGSDITTDNIGAKKTTEQIGEMNGKTVSGSRSDEQTEGNRSDNTQNGARKNTSTNNVSPFEKTGFVAKDQTITDDIAVTDVFTKGAQTDHFTKGEQSDTAHTDQHTNIYNEDKHTDTSKLEHGHVIDRELERSGNIGVTTSQQMIDSEREIALFNIYKVIANLIIDAVCKRVVFY